ncbi:CMGC/CDK protein kinase [Paracoccidioides brasiliensis Pb18]|uniref:cyclin-dependent kinase n=2 Tax=Paracoccidioides brasiliensis TaxID=121759 RepID=C1G383_PARBD|nr:CMGC/CDK protein kinase [Paracoccidioides brasiliensis Pb18]EEH45249.1 CMGC/CDK protein kinase [Paracoccidioides brasiliensis Pb18]ODH35817.1 CMGC/CDK protein kinase [Paracoccidioides brasiliensis]ODH51283.1 CMGC/CDK protein kinase [Paracoccidioides brasiliensis]
MSSAPKSRWAEDDAETEALLEQKRREKEERKRAKAEKQRQQEEAQKKLLVQQRTDEAANGSLQTQEDSLNGDVGRPSKRRRLSNKPEAQPDIGDNKPLSLLRFPAPEWSPCRHIDNFERLNHIEEGSYGLVSRAKEVATGEIVALKRLKMEYCKDGFPITGLREIQTLLESRHTNIVHLREVVMGAAMDDVYLVMDFLEHDLKTLLDDMREPFLPSETKTLLLQIMSATEFLHSHWIMHRDLKTSNLLMNNRGEIKLADFGMARYYGDPPPKLTQLVVTLWYRSPELLLGADKYGPEIDMWSIGCIFGELLTKEPLFQGKNEVDQLSKIFALTGPPTTQTWPSFRSLPNAKSLRLPVNAPPSTATTDACVPLLTRSKFPYLTTAGLTLLSHLLALNPTSRPDASTCLSHPYFREDPKPKAKEMFPTFPSRAGMEKRRRRETPEAPKRGQEAPRLDFANVFGGWDGDGTGGEAGPGAGTGAGFTLRLG